jgi:hypothetical protein
LISNKPKHCPTRTDTSPWDIRTRGHEGNTAQIQQKNKNCNIKATRQVVLCEIPKYLSCCKNKGKNISDKKHQGSITQDDDKPGSNTSIDHVYANVTCLHYTVSLIRFNS